MLEFKEPSPKKIAEEKIYLDMGVSEQEFTMIKDFLGRLPNYTELGLFSVMWSEHCSYKNSKVVLKQFPTSGEHVLQGPGEGAGIVDIGDKQAVVFKIESHNHPTAVEPYQGAATGVGGIIRDIFSMGARPIAILNSLRFGELNQPRVKYLLKQAAAGIADYGNCMEIPTVGGEIYFDACYEANPLVNAMCVGVVHHDQVQKGIAAGVGNSVIYVGAATGRDGIHGATFASKELEEADDGEIAVQIGDPALEKVLLEACLEMIENPALIGIQDMGAAGLTSSSSEMASKADNGIELTLDLVPQREDGMSAYEIMLSESQERMLLVVEKGHEAEFIAICKKWGLEGVNIGRVTDDGQMRLIHHGRVVAEVPVKSLVDDAPVYKKPSKQPDSFLLNQKLDIIDIPISNPSAVLKQLLSMPSIASKEWVYSQYNSSIGSHTLVKPGSDAAVVRIEGTRKALAVTTDCNSGYLYLDPYQGGAIAVAEAARNVVCAGAKPLAVTDGLNFGSPENPEIFWQLEQAAAGISEACRKLNSPVISGNVSLYNESDEKPIYPTPIIGMVGLVEDLDQVTTQFYKQADDIIVLLGRTLPELGGSHLQKLKEKVLRGRIPQIDLDYEKRVQDVTLTAVKQGLLHSAHDVSEGGLAVAVVESAFGTNLGVNIKLRSDLSLSALLFGESQSRIVVSLSESNLDKLVKLAEDADVEVCVIGRVNGDDCTVFTVNNQTVIDCKMSELEQAWKEGVPCLMNT